MSTIVIMPGGFHPFHAGHASLYQSALKAFPGAEVYVAATNDTKTRPFPFSIKEKLAKVAGVAPGHFIQVKSPFQPKEITGHYNPDKDVVIFVRSEKDRNESPKPGGMKKDGTPAYFQPWTGKDVQSFGQHAYMAYLPTVEFGPGIKSATEIRNAWPKLDDRRKTAMVMSLYPATQKNSKLAANIVKMLDMGMGNELAENETLDEGPYVQRIVHPNKINLYLRVSNKKPPLLMATDLPYNLFDKFVAKVIEKYPQFKQTDFSFKSADKVIAEENDEIVDPELHKMLNYAKVHYPNSPNKQVAFMKFVQRALKHSEQADTSQDTKLGILDKEVDQLQRTVSKLSNVTESADYLEEK